ncbi:MAG TPA: phosphoribosylaminoimidazolesuccinocarboxamide synthase [Methanoculleus sp.]|nr:phosphoribosylaminoimidazolesuccinocarboxamide synthase [Methanoculleus sp.]
MNSEPLYEGKAKSVYRSEEAGELVVRFRDDITAFDGEKKDVLPGKGVFNAVVSAFFFTYLEKRGIATHFIRMVNERTMIVKELAMVPLEVIVRNRAAGSIVRRYPFSEGQVLDPPVVVMDFKDDTRHDPMINDDIIVALGLLTREEIAAIRTRALEINRLLSEYFREQGITLVDFKIEFGKREGSIVLGDEISMDSMRLWDMETGESLDKDVYRFDKGDVLSAYERVVQRIIPGYFGGKE